MKGVPVIIFLVCTLLLQACVADNDPMDTEQCELEDLDYNGVCVDSCPQDTYQAGTTCVEEILFRLPVVNQSGVLLDSLVFGVDNDLEPGQSDADCRNYNGLGFPFCYDQHDGSDFMLKGGFMTMDNGSASVVAAADGEVIDVRDGNYDRCHLDLATQYIICEGDLITPANYVKIRHLDGMETWYWHLKKESVSVEVGEQVKCGDHLGLIGSSGISTAPHLHFEVHDADGNTIDPYAGPFSQSKSYWVEQDGEYSLPSEECQGLR